MFAGLGASNRFFEVLVTVFKVGHDWPFFHPTLVYIHHCRTPLCKFYILGIFFVVLSIFVRLFVLKVAYYGCNRSFIFTPSFNERFPSFQSDDIAAKSYVFRDLPL